MLSFLEMLDKIQQDISGIADADARAKAQSKFELLPKDPSRWKATSYTTFMDSAPGQISGSASKEEIEALYKKGVEEDAKGREGLVDSEHYESMKERGDAGFDIAFEATERTTPEGTGVDNAEFYTFQITANDNSSDFTVQHSKGTASEVMRYGKHKEWGTYDKSRKTTFRPGTYMTQDNYTFTNGDKRGSKPKVTDIYESSTTTSYDENLEESHKTNSHYTQFLDDKLRTHQEKTIDEKDRTVTTHTEETTYGPVMWDKTTKTEEKDKWLDQTKVLAQDRSYGFISDLKDDKMTAEEAKEQVAAIDKELAEMDKDPVDNMPLVKGNDPNDKIEIEPEIDVEVKPMGVMPEDKQF